MHTWPERTTFTLVKVARKKTRLCDFFRLKLRLTLPDFNESNNKNFTYFSSVEGKNDEMKHSCRSKHIR